MAAQESDQDILNGLGSVTERMDFVADVENLKCLEEKCAWWNDDFGACSLTALAMVATRPVVIREQLGHG